jgi:hypothetical protein
MKTIDPKALKILCSYNPNQPRETTTEEFALLKTAGLAFDPIKLTHDELVKWALREFASCNKKSVADSYLIGVGRNQSNLRAPLAAYSVMTHFPIHRYQTITDRYCSTCAELQNPEIDLTFVNRCRWSGSLIGREPSRLAFYLQQHNADEIDKPSEADIRKFCDVLDVIGACPQEEKPTTLYKKIRKIPGIKMSDEEGRHFLDTLGYAGILQTPEHQGFIYRYVGHITPAKSHSSDWSYPVDFWTGKNGVNTDALKYWFSAYPQIANWAPKP